MTYQYIIMWMCCRLAFQYLHGHLGASRDHIYRLPHDIRCQLPYLVQSLYHQDVSCWKRLQFITAVSVQPEMDIQEARVQCLRRLTQSTRRTSWKLVGNPGFRLVFNYLWTSSQLFGLPTSCRPDRSITTCRHRFITLATCWQRIEF